MSICVRIYVCGVYNMCVINKNNAQVFVFSRGVYSRIKERVKTRGVSDIPTSEMSNYFSPLFAEHVGTVKVWIEDLVLIAVFKSINLNFIRTYDKYFSLNCEKNISKYNLIYTSMYIFLF